MSHFWFSSTLERHLESLLSSHPPLDKRIAAIDASFLAVQRGKEITAQQNVPPTSNESVALTQSVSAMAGNVLPGHMTYAAEMYRRFSPEIMAVVHSPNHVMAVIYALLILHSGEQPYFPQRNDAVMKLAVELRQQLSQLDRRHRLPLLDLALPILQSMDAAKKQELLQGLQAHFTSAPEFDLFEFVLISIIKQRLRREYGCDEKIKFHSFKPLMFDVQMILSLLAKAGGRADEAEALYQRNMAVFFPANNLPCFSGLMDYERLMEALDNLRHTSLPNRKLFIDVCADMAKHDGILMPEEYELIRAIAESLDCPMPPLLAA